MQLQISTGSAAIASASGSHSRTGSAILAYNAIVPASAPLYYNPLVNGQPVGAPSMSKSSSAQGVPGNPHDHPTPLASAQQHNMSGFPFPAFVNGASAAPVAPPLVSLDRPGANGNGVVRNGAGDDEMSPVWPTGPPLRPLDYAKLSTAEQVHDELEKTIKELGQWLWVVDDGLSRILQD